MDNFLGTLVFLLPGLMAYFWLQSFGLNPPVKHTGPEITGISALLWLPISFLTLCLLNVWASLIENCISLLNMKVAWTIDDFKEATSDFRYLVLFITVSAVVSFGVCFIWSKWLFKGQEWLINYVRNSRGIASLDGRSTVWDEMFSYNNAQVVSISKVDKPDEKPIIGEVTNVSRPFEPERILVVGKGALWERIIEKYNPIPEHVYVDVKAGMIIKIFNTPQMVEFYKEQESEVIPTSRFS